jgi:hypothetical protein
MPCRPQHRRIVGRSLLPGSGPQVCQGLVQRRSSTGAAQRVVSGGCSRVGDGGMVRATHCWCASVLFTLRTSLGHINHGLDLVAMSKNATHPKDYRGGL